MHTHSMHFLAYLLEDLRPFHTVPRHWPLPRDSPFRFPSYTDVCVTPHCVRVRRGYVRYRGFIFVDSLFS